MWVQFFYWGCESPRKILKIIYKKDFITKCYSIGYAGIFNAILIALGNITFITSLENTNVANTLIMISLGPFMAAIMGSLFLNERPNTRTWITICFCFIFVVFLRSETWNWHNNEYYYNCDND